MLAPSSTLASSTITEILISEVVIIWMLIPAFPRRSNILAATPECERIPMPTTLSLAIPPWAAKPLAPISGTIGPRCFSIFGNSSARVVNEISVRAGG